MWIRSSVACSARLSLGFLLAVAFASAAPAQVTNESDGDPAPAAKVGSVSTEAVEDTIRLLRIVALGLTDDRDRGRAFSGLVAAQLARDKFKSYRIEYKNIRDPLWRARAQVEVAAYHLRKGRTKTAAKTLDAAVKTLPVKNRTRGADDTFRDISLRFADMEDYGKALALANRLSALWERLDLVLKIADKQVGDPNRKIAAGATKTYLAAFELTKKLKDDKARIADVLLRISQALIAAGKTRDALRTLEHLQAFLVRNTFDGRDDRIARLAGAYVLAKDNNTAMQIVRTIEDVANRSRAISAVAGAIGITDNIDAAVPLFKLAFQQSERIESTPRRYEVLTHLVRQQTLVGRLADAFKTAGWVRERRDQAITMMTMAETLLERKEYDNALKLVDYIPFIGMRAEIFNTVALARGHGGAAVEASALLAKGLADTPLQKDGESDRLETALLQAVEVQDRVGAPEAAPSLFARIQKLSYSLPELKDQVAVLTRVASAFANIDKPVAAREVLDDAWRLTWRDTAHPDFAVMMSDITEAQLASGFVLSAFDTAARIPNGPLRGNEDDKGDPDALVPTETSRDSALRQVGIAAAVRGRPNLSIRAVRAIEDETPRAHAVADVAVAVAKRERN